MAMKRKFEIESDDSTPTPNSAKQLKLVPFPNYEPDLDVAMSDVEPTSATISDQPHHMRLPSNASSNSSDSDSNSPVYPSFNLYPLPFFNNHGVVDTNSHSFSHIVKASTPPPSSVGLLQPNGNFSHHGSNCSQIPKLKVACAAGPSGQRTMWSFCEQCGSISMVESD